MIVDHAAHDVGLGSELRAFLPIAEHGSRSRSASGVGTLAAQLQGCLARLVALFRQATTFTYWNHENKSPKLTIMAIPIQLGRPVGSR